MKIFSDLQPATAMYIKEHYPNQTVYCMGTRSRLQANRGKRPYVVTEVS